MTASSATTAPWQQLSWALVAGDESESERILRRARADGLTRRDVCVQVITPAMHEVGRLWQLDELTTVEEHIATAIAWAAMVRMPLLPRELPGYGLSAIVGTCEPDQHALGARMVADALREDGWDVVYLGCGVPLNDLVAFADLRRPDVVALSVGMASHLAAAKVTTLALHSLAIPPRVLLGGFGCHGPEAHRVGADAVSTDLAATTPLVLELC